MKFKKIVVGAFVLMSLLCATSAVAKRNKKSAKYKDNAALMTKSKEQFKTGLDLVGVEDFESAAIAFEAAYDLYPANGVLYNLAECYKALHRYSEAHDALQALQSQLGTGRNDDKLRPLVETRMRELQAIVGFLSIEVNYPGATILLDDKELGISPLEKSTILGPGIYKILVALEGFEIATREIKMVPKAQLKEIFELIPSKKESAIMEDAKKDAPPSLKPLFWGGVAGTVATGVAGGIFWGLTAKQDADIDTEIDKQRDATSRDLSSVEKLDRKRVQYHNTALGLSIAAGVFAVGTAVLLVLDRQFSKEEALGSIDVSVLPGSVVVSF